MSQRNSEYERKPHDLYQTPHWCTEVLLAHLPEPSGLIWEPACGDGQMVNVLKGRTDVIATDITRGSDFLLAKSAHPDISEIITNPPYGSRGTLAHKFIRHALALTKAQRGKVAMLLRVDFDSAKTRSDVFGNHPAFARKIVLRKRIQWFGKGKNGSSENHAWFVWDWSHSGSPTIGYAP